MQKSLAKLQQLANIALVTTTLTCSVFLLSNYWYAKLHNPSMASRLVPSMMLYWDIHRLLRPIQLCLTAGVSIAIYANPTFVWRFTYIVCALLGIAAMIF